MNKVVIFGSINLDLVTKIADHPKPGETIFGSNCQTLAGGKGANQALAASNCKYVNSFMIGAVGKDNFAGPALANLKASNLNIEHVKHIDNMATGVALIAVDKAGENSIIVTPGANHRVTTKQLDAVKFNSGDVLLTQNELLSSETFAAHQFAKHVGATVVHNAAPAHVLTTKQLSNIDYLIVNETELTIVANGFGINKTTPLKTTQELVQKTNTKLIVTLGPKGAIFVSNTHTLNAQPTKIEVVDTTGAGDAFCGTFAANLAMNLHIEKALENSVEAGGIACTHFGAQKSNN